MSMDRCTRCDNLVDTDYDLECYESDKCVCESCREHDELGTYEDLPANNEHKPPYTTSTSVLVRITAPHFCAGIALSHQSAVPHHCAPILNYMRSWSPELIKKYCLQKNWKYEETP